VSGEFAPKNSPTDTPKKIVPGADLTARVRRAVDDRVTGKVEKFCEGGTIVHIDIDASELNKNKRRSCPS